MSYVAAILARIFLWGARWIWNLCRIYEFRAPFFFGKDFCLFLGEFYQEYGFLPPRRWLLLALQLKSIWYVTSFFASVHVCLPKVQENLVCHLYFLLMYMSWKLTPETRFYEVELAFLIGKGHEDFIYFSHSLENQVINCLWVEANKTYPYSMKCPVSV